jgi:hypothetical protein
MSTPCPHPHVDGEEVCKFCCTCDYCTVVREFEDDIHRAVRFPVVDPPDRAEFEEWAAEQDAFMDSQAEDQILRADKEHGA